MQRDSNRTRVWFPLFSYFESSVEGIVPNEYDTPGEIVSNIVNFIKSKFSAVIQCNNVQRVLYSCSNNNSEVNNVGIVETKKSK